MQVCSAVAQPGVFVSTTGSGRNITVHRIRRFAVAQPRTITGARQSPITLYHKRPASQANGDEQLR